ncbi:hypothetical protein AB0D56_32635 [Streptomyces sp. NPDC048209]|uniref:hypothetical protein n=1 Tax=Streptomyces TaxID=1883 RepID=UPI0029A1690C|nr:MULTISPECIES: hypothetical protein [unclassified Streptomyces]MDX3186176.1 hypothetical protein [Streptomyces sp. ME02-7008A-1]MDX3307085.1 hypothetical protein [Streptomyces sp. ME02-7008A]
MRMPDIPERLRHPRGAVIAALGVITLAVAILSVAVTYNILESKFGGWAIPTVVALDALWVIFQATEILAGNNRVRAKRVQWAGMALTLINAAIPTAHLIVAAQHGTPLDMAVVITPVAILFTKGAWWWALPSLGRPVSEATRQTIATKRQTVADKLEEMEAEAAHRIELLALATTLETRVAEAETDYRVAMLKAQQDMAEQLHEQAQTTEKTVSEKPLPASVAAIRLPVLEEWTPTAPALPGTPGGTLALTGGAGVTQVSAPAAGTGTPGGTPEDAAVTPGGTPEDAAVTPGGTPEEQAARAAALADLAAVAGVPVPEPGEPLTDGQLDVALRHLRYVDDPPQSYRQARDEFRDLGFVGSERRVRRAWAELMEKEEEANGPQVDRDGGAEQTEDEDTTEDAGA